MVKKVLLSGIQPTGDVSIGQYLGVLKNWLTYQEQYDCYFMVADLHALTTQPDAQVFCQRRFDSMAFFLAMGLDPASCTLFFQSQVSAHSELCWLLSNQAFMGQLSRMTQFKDKSKKQGQSIAVGLFTYPVMMAADILLYGAEVVPVGDDQKQHLELVRDLVLRVNKEFNLSLKQPAPLMSELGGRIKALQEPHKKMSKSDDNKNNGIFFHDTESQIRKKIMRAVTDSDAQFHYDPLNKAGLANLIDLYACLTKCSVTDVVGQFDGCGYGDFKKDLAEKVVAEMMPIQEKWHDWRHRRQDMRDLLEDSHARAQACANSHMALIMKQFGFGDESPC